MRPAVDRFLGDDRDARRDLGERGGDRRLGGAVGLGHRRRSGFFSTVRPPRAHLQDDRAGRDGSRRQAASTRSGLSGKAIGRSSLKQERAGQDKKQKAAMRRA